MPLVESERIRARVDDGATRPRAAMRMKSMYIISMRLSRRVGGAMAVGAAAVDAGVVAARALW